MVKRLSARRIQQAWYSFWAIAAGLFAFVVLSHSAAAGPTNWGDFQDSNQTIYLYFNTVGTDGVAETLASGAVEIYEDGSTTQITTAETLTASFDSIVGLNQLAVDLSDAGFEDGKTYTVMLTAGAVDSVSVVGRIVGVFSIGRYATAPDGFDGLDIDGSGAVIIQDGTDPGQIATTSGAIDAVTTTGTVTNGVNVTQLLGTALTDVGSGDFGSTLAGNFSVLFGQSTNESNTAVGASEINNILTRTNRIPNIAAGSSGGLFIAGSNSPTTVNFTGALSGTVGGIAGTITTLDQLDTAQDTQHGTTQTAIADVPTVTEFNAGLAALPQTGDLASEGDIADAVLDEALAGHATSGTLGKAITDALTAVGTTIPALIGTPDVTLADDIAGIGAAGATQPRINRKPDPGFTIQVSRRADGTYKCTKPIRLTAGAINAVYAFIDMAPLFGAENFVETVGTPIVSGGSVTASATGPRDTYAIVELDGTATAGEERTVTVPVTMTSGTQLNVVFDLEVFE